ncbi:MAG: AAA family ATPase [bacterium]
MNNTENIVGIGGYSRSGKDTLATLLLSAGYFGISVGDIAREYSMERHKDSKSPISRINLTETSNWLREQKGPDVFMKIALDKYRQALKTKEYKGMLIWSIRAPIEADFIIKNKGTLIWIDSKAKTRYKRFLENLRTGEVSIDFDEYLRQEQTQVVPQPDIDPLIQMNMDYVKEKANLTLDNNFEGTEKFLEYAKQRVNSIL